MAIVTPTTETKHGRVTVKWSGVVTGDTITKHVVIGRPDLIVFQGGGTFANGSSVGLTGSADGTEFIAATDMTQTAISAKLAAFAVGVLEPFMQFKPTITSGSSDAVDFWLTYWIRQV